MMHETQIGTENCQTMAFFCIHHNMHFNLWKKHLTLETLGDYMDTWKMTHFNELFFCEFALPIGPFKAMIGTNNNPMVRR
jgi:hypothetical protein